MSKESKACLVFKVQMVKRALLALLVRLALKEREVLSVPQALLAL